MNASYQFSNKKNCYKGNIHCHSNLSDGKLTPKELVQMYKDKNYSFLSFSEHELFTNLSEFNDNNFIIIPAIEASVSVPRGDECYHIHGIQGSKSYIRNAKKTPLSPNYLMPEHIWTDINTVQTLIDDLTSTGNLVMLNHPVWSQNELSDFEKLNGYFALEIFNYSCEVETKTGLSTAYWDSLLRKGIKIWGIATDDNHNYNYFDDAPYTWDSFGGWINVYADDLSQDSITNSLLEGNFYSSSGPEIYNYGIRDGELFVECSPVEKIYFLSSHRGYSRRSKFNEPITSSSYKLSGQETYVRIECEDKNGKTAWTNPIFLK